jgi:ferritin-like metal-binding protein YciE
VHDFKGAKIYVGARVKVISIDQSIMSELTEGEVRDINSMLGEVFEVYEIDEYGQAWVEKWWHLGEGKSYSHSLGLSSSELEFIEA